MPLACAAWPSASTTALKTGPIGTARMSSCRVPEEIRLMSSRSSMRRGLGAGVALDGGGRLEHVGLAGAGPAEQVGPAQDGAQRRAQLVRQGGQELVLHAAGLFGGDPGFALGEQQGLALGLEVLLVADVDRHAVETGRLVLGVPVDAALCTQPSRLRSRRDGAVLHIVLNLRRRSPVRWRAGCAPRRRGEAPRKSDRSRRWRRPPARNAPCTCRSTRCGRAGTGSGRCRARPACKASCKVSRARSAPASARRSACRAASTASMWRRVSYWRARARSAERAALARVSASSGRSRSTTLPSRSRASAAAPGRRPLRRVASTTNGKSDHDGCASTVRASTSIWPTNDSSVTKARAAPASMAAARSVSCGQTSACMASSRSTLQMTSASRPRGAWTRTRRQAAFVSGDVTRHFRPGAGSNRRTWADPTALPRSSSAAHPPADPTLRRAGTRGWCARSAKSGS